MFQARKAGCGRSFRFFYFTDCFRLVLRASVTSLLLLAGVVGLPAHAAAVGSTAGEFSVSDSGTARYRIPLVLPPGTAGMTPSLSLAYSSQSGDGLAGWGWHLSGLSAIHRCGATYAQNDKKRAVTNTDTDRLCLDGNQLMLVAGTYLHAGAEYRTERETFTRVTQISSGTGLYFKAEQKNGRIVYYGSTSDARPLTDAGDAVREWRVSKIKDRAGNAILFSYTRDPGGAILPDDISYTKTAGGSAYNTISFTYGARPVAEIVPAYTAGNAVGREKRLTTITVKHGTTIARQYTLTYKSSLSPVSNHSRLASVQECGMGGTECFAPVQFDWYNAAATFSSADYSIGSPWAARWADINGDGRDDYYYWGGRMEESNPNPFEEPIVWYTKMGYRITGADGGVETGGDTDIAWGEEAGKNATPLDFDGDGDSEILYSRDGAYVARWNGSGFDEITLAAGPAGGKVADVNGDGYDDLLVPSTQHVQVFLNQRTGDAQAFAGTPLTISFPNSEDLAGAILDPDGNDPSSTTNPWPGPPAVDDDEYFRQADFNGDGRTDLLTLTMETYTDCDITCKNLTRTRRFVVYSDFQATGGGYTLLDLGLTTETGDFKFLTPLDINGDGLTDLAYYDVGAGHWWTRLSTGTDFAPAVNASGGFYTDENFGVMVADANQDGLQDLFLPVPVSSDVTQPPGPEYIWKVKYSTGATLGALVAHDLDYRDDLTYKAPPTLRSLDLNGDGTREILFFRTLNRAGNAADGFAPPADQLKKITDSFGNVTTIDYRPLADSAIYSATPQPAITDAYPYHPKRFVVSDYTAPDGAGGTFTVSYHYTGGVRDHFGRGFLGFAEREVTDSRTSATVTTTYRQDFPYTGLPKQKDLRAPDDSLISRTTITPAQDTWGSGDEQRVLTYPATTVEKSYAVGGALDGQLLKTTTTQIGDPDDYGNPGNTTVTVAGNGETFTTSKTQTYVNNTSSWCLGLVAGSSITQQLPNGASITRASNAQYDATTCRLTQQTQLAVDPTYGDLSLTTAYAYDNWGNITATTVSAPGLAPRSSHTSYVGYQGRFPDSATNAAGHITTFTWDETLGLQTGVTDPNNLTASTTYDVFGRPATQAAPDGATTTFSYDWCALDDCGVVGGVYQINQHSETGAQNVTVFDAFGRELMTGAPLLNGAWRYHFTRYDALGRVARQSQPFTTGGELGGSSAMPEPPGFAPTPDDADTKSPDGRYWMLYQYDLLGRVTVVQHPYNPATGNGGGQTTTQYNGFVTTVTDPNGHSSSKTVNAIGQTVQMTDALGNTTSYQYDAAGNLIKTTDSTGNVIAMQYDLRGNKRVMDDPDMGHWTYTYNAYGELVQQTDAKGQITQLDYDALGRLISRTDGAGSANESTSTWTYDTAAYGIGKLASVTQSSGYAEHYTYDDLSRVTAVMTTVDDTDYTVSTSYDQYSRVKTVAYPQSVATDNNPVNAIAQVLPDTTVTTGATVTLDGSQSYDNDGFQTLSYQWTQTGGPAVTLSGAASVQAGLTPTQAGVYTFSLTVSDGVDTATDSLTLTVQPPMPGSLTVSDGAISPDGAYTLNWAAPVGGLLSGGEYRVDEDADPQFGSPAPVYQGTGTSAPISGKDNGAWNYRVQTCATGQCSDWRSASVLVQRPPSAPGTPQISPNPSSTGDYTVSWTSPGSGQYTGYTLHESPTGNSWNLNPGVDSKAFYNQPDEHTYSYQVEACNGQSCTGSGSASVRIISEPGTPSSLNVPSSTTTGSVALSWGAASGVVSQYQLQESRSSGFGTITDSWTNTDPDDHTRTITVNGNDTFYYRVRAVHEYAGVKQYGAWRNGNRGVRNYEAPGLPTGLNATFAAGAYGSGTVTVSWGTASGDVSQYELQEAYRSGVHHSWGAWQTVQSSTARSWSGHKSPPGIFKYRVRACNGPVCGDYASSSDIIYVYEPDLGPLCPPKCDPGVMAEPQTKPDAPQLAVRAVAVPPAPAAGSSAPLIKGASGRSPVGGFGLRHVAYRPNTQHHTNDASTARESGYRLMAPPRPYDLARGASPLTPSPRVGEGWGEGVTTRPSAFTPLYATAFTPNRADRHGSRDSGWGFAAFEKISGDGSGYRFTVEYIYDAYGHLAQVRNAQDQNLVYWQATTADAYGHITQASFGNGLVTRQTFDPATGQVQAITTGPAGNPSQVQNLAYAFDQVGNLMQRQDLNRTLTESFSYDALNRVTQTAVNSIVTQSLTYDALGNLQGKTVSGTATTYVYDLAAQAGPHAVTALKDAGGVITASYHYDANGNLTNGGGRTVTWNAANYPVSIAQGSHTTAFTYGPNRQRVTQTETTGGTFISTTVSIGALFEQTTDAGGQTTYRHFIRAGSQTIAIHTRTSDYTQTTTWLHRDHLGSVSAISNEDGDVIASMSFDAWGNRRNPDTWQGSATNPAPDETDRGYTGHKMLDEVGLIHMNGRVYDPTLGRFLSADPIIQAPYNSQSYNRYSYVWNNPLSNTDPSGFQTNQDDDKIKCDPEGNCYVEREDLPEKEREKWDWCKEHGIKCQAVQTKDGLKIGVPKSEVQRLITQQSKTSEGTILNPNDKFGPDGEPRVLVHDNTTGGLMYVDRAVAADVYHAQQAGKSLGEYSCSSSEKCKAAKAAKTLAITSIAATGGTAILISTVGRTAATVYLGRVAFTADSIAYYLQPNKTPGDHLVFWGTVGVGYGVKYFDTEFELLYLSGDMGQRMYQIQDGGNGQ